MINGVSEYTIVRDSSERWPEFIHFGLECGFR